MRLILIAGCLLLVCVATAPLAQNAGMPVLERFESAPFLPLDVQAHYISSYDRSGKNDDGFRGTYSALYQDTNGEHVIFDVKGPGCVYTLWFTSREDGWSPLGWGHIRFYFDDESQPRLDLDSAELFSGRRAPFRFPFVFNPFSSTGGYVCYLPFPFQKRLKIATEKRVGFYNIYYHSYTADRSVKSWSGGEATETVTRIWSQPGRDPKDTNGNEYFSGTVEVSASKDGNPGVSAVFERRAKGSVASLRLNPLFPLTPYELNHIYLRIYWDGEESPSVNAPLGIFFGSGLGEASVRAVPIGMSPSGDYYCYFPMPFWSQARLELVNENPGPTPKIWWEIGIKPEISKNYPKSECGYFKTQYQRAWPTILGKDFELLHTRGRGVLMGQAMTVEPLRAENKKWWEGDLRLYLDGRRHPDFHGTGHEDEYLGGWSNEWLMNPYSLPMHGEPKTDHLTQIDFQWNASTTVYRFFPGGVPFQSEVALSTEHGVDNSATAFYSSLAFYYEQSNAMVRVDELDVGKTAEEARHQYENGDKAPVVQHTFQFEGVADQEDVTDEGREITRSSKFTLKLPDNCSGIRLRRRYDQLKRQEAEIWVNDQQVGIWYTAATNLHKRWAEGDFIIPASATRGRSELQIEVRVRQGPWTEYRYELWALPDSNTHPH